MIARLVTAGLCNPKRCGNADTPLKHAKEPVLTIDMWEHAYSIDFRNERPKYVESFWKAANWEFAGKCHAAAVK